MCITFGRRAAPLTCGRGVARDVMPPDADAGTVRTPPGPDWGPSPCRVVSGTVPLTRCHGDRPRDGLSVPSTVLTPPAHDASATGHLWHFCTGRADLRRFRRKINAVTAHALRMT